MSEGWILYSLGHNILECEFEYNTCTIIHSYKSNLCALGSMLKCRKRKKKPKLPEGKMYLNFRQSTALVTDQMNEATARRQASEAVSKVHGRTSHRRETDRQTDGEKERARERERKGGKRR